MNKPETYLNPEDGITYCRVCGQPRTMRTRFPFDSREHLVPVLCSCQAMEAQLEREAQERKQRMILTQQIRSAGLQESFLGGCRFSNDDGRCGPVMDKIHRYADHWTEMYRTNSGLLIYGPVGTGKTYAAACIANQLIENAVPVLMSSASHTLNTLAALHSGDRESFLDSLANYELMILDDYGTQQSASYIQELAYQLIDSRYRCHKPLILTTNLPLSAFRSPPDIESQRLYSRINEMCTPLLFDGTDHRIETARQKLKNLKPIITGGNEYA